MPNLFRAAAGIEHMEQLAASDSIIHRLHPLAKLMTTVTYIVLTVSFSSRNVSGLVPFLLFPVILMSLSGTPYRPLLKRLLVALPFCLMGGVGNLIFVREHAFSIGAFSVTVGMISFFSIVLKTFLTVLSVLLLIATTSFVQISDQLVSLHVPKILCLQLTMTYRYISVLLDEAARMFTAYQLRAPEQKGIRMKDMGSFIGQLVLRSFDRAERVYRSMKCRGFDGKYRGKGAGRFRCSDGIYSAAVILSLFLFRFVNISLFLGRLV